MVYLQRIQWVLVRTYIWFHLPDRVINVGKNSIHGSHGNGVQTQSDKDENSNMSLKGVERGYMKHEANSRMLQSAQLLICFSHCDFLLFLLLASQTAPRLWKPTREIHTEKKCLQHCFHWFGTHEFINWSNSEKQETISVTCHLSEAASRKHQGDPWYPAFNFSSFGGSEWDLLVTSFLDMPWGQLRLCTGCLTYGGFFNYQIFKSYEKLCWKVLCKYVPSILWL